MRESMRVGLIVLLSLLSAPAAADCSPTLFASGSGLATYVTREDRRELEQLIGTQLDHVVCGRMRRVYKYVQGVVIRRGFFVLTKNELLFVHERGEKEVLFRAAFGDVDGLSRTVFGPGVDNTLFLSLATDAGWFRFELTCAGGAERVVDELQRRTTGITRAPAWQSGPWHSCN
jgi:hypothetical protein